MLYAEIPSLRLFLESKEAIQAQGTLFMTRLQSEERELIFIHHQSEDVDELNEESISLLIQQLETAYANTTLYDDHLELNLAMERFVPDSTLKHLEHQSITSVDIGQRATVTASTLSLDIRGFTSLCEKLTSNDSFRLINALLALLGPVIERHHGSILKFVGDGIIAMFSRGEEMFKIPLSAALNSRKLSVPSMLPHPSCAPTHLSLMHPSELESGSILAKCI